MGYLKLQLEFDDDGTGELFAVVESNGFSGHSSAWFDLVSLVETAKQFAQYPLSNDSPACLIGGYWNDEKPPTLATLAQERLHISAYPTNTRGGIAVHVKMTHEAGQGALHFVAVELCTSYEQMAQFSKALIALANEEVKEVVLDETIS